MPVIDTASVALLTALIGTVVIPLLRWWLDKRKQDEDETTNFKKLNDGSLQAGSAEWRQLYEKMETRVNFLETKQEDYDALKADRSQMAQRITVIESELANLKDAFEYLAHEVETTNQQSVNIARKIARGELKLPKVG